MSAYLKEYNLVYWLSKVIVHLGFILFERLEIRDERKVPRTGGLLLVVNHLSHLDPPMVAATCFRKAHFLAKRELFKGIFMGWYMSASGQIPVDRGQGKDAVEVAVNFLKKGKCICIFPEGTRSRTGEMQPPHTGIVVIASRVDVPIVPILIEGTFDAMPPKNSFPRLYKKMRITYGDPFYLTEAQKDLSSKDKMKETADFIMQRIRSVGTT